MKGVQLQRDHLIMQAISPAPQLRSAEGSLHMHSHEVFWEVSIQEWPVVSGRHQQEEQRSAKSATSVPCSLL